MSRSKRTRQAAKRKSVSSFDFGWRALVVPALLLAAATVLLYAPISSHSFTNYDDEPYISTNPNVQQGLNWRTVKWAFTHFYEGNWHPLTWLAHAADFQMYGATAGGHHVTSLLLHVVNMLLLFLLLARATGLRARSMIVAALFALHPLNVESVAWAAELKNVLCSLFFFLALGAYGWYVQKSSVSRYAAVVVLFLFGLASKPMVITFPFVLLLLDFWPLGRIQGWTSPSALLPVTQKSFASLLLEKLPMLPLCIGSAIITYLAEHSANAEKFISVSLPLRVENAIYSYAMYIWNAFWPSGLAVFYPHPSGSLAPWRLEVATFFLIAVSVLVWRESRGHGYLLTGWLWYLGMLVPVIGLVQVGGQARADRYTYLPLIGVFVMTVWGLGDFAREKKWSPAAQCAAALLILAALAVTARKQISYWENSYELWTRALDVTRDNRIAEHNLANELVRLHRDPEAIPHLQRAVEFNPQDMVSAANLGAALSKTGRHEDAVKEYEIVLRGSSDPKILLGVYYNLSIEYHLLGNDTQAAECHRQFLQEVNKLGIVWPSGLNGGSG